ncbi:hypothetical protein SAMN04488556_3637 [Halostagnicola kamekurae]|uniref:Uncharacterized protein n=1 Tax=Halostagnicola kamekurae TaxID=619731 RepID=A0A1I6U8J2_9EURY|nr:hypothetical protein SAMN04488556_3637 [Halostagnicola kamekurae]
MDTEPHGNRAELASGPEIASQTGELSRRIDENSQASGRSGRSSLSSRQQTDGSIV